MQLSAPSTLIGWELFYLYERGYMAKSQTVNKYAHLEYRVLHELDISINEYWYLDMVYQLSRDGWCYKSLQSVADDMKLSKQGVVKMRDRLIQRGFIKKNIKGHVKTEVAYNSVYRLDENEYKTTKKRTTQLHNRTTEYNATVQLSSTKNNKENKKRLDNLEGIKKYQQMRARLGL